MLADTAGTMRLARTTASLALAASLLAMPSLTTAQADEPSTDSSAPLALRPDGRLPLEGTPWRLRAYRWRGLERAPGPEVAAAMTLSAGKLDASGGCTGFGGSYGTVGSAIDFDLKRLKDNHCAEQTTMVQLGMLEGLRKASHFEMDRAPDGGGDELVLYGASGTELLRFGLDDIAALDIGEWHLEAFTVDGQRTVADPEQAAVLTFRPRKTNTARRVSSGRLDGSSGCNAIVGEFYRHAGVVSFGELERTDAPCTPAVQAQEEAIVSVLDATSIRLALPPDRLLLTSVDTGDALELTASQPLEGSTWLLTKIARAERPLDPVVLWLDNGNASGEGPCGAYSASYATDGLFLTFSDVAGADDDTCEAAAAEGALLAALRATVRIDHDQPQLRLVDARGRIVARFKAPSAP